MQHLNSATGATPAGRAVHGWWAMPQALGPYGILAVPALVTADLFFIASTHYGHDHVIMSAYWVGVGVLSTV
jgi:hypothetical protein